MRVECSCEFGGMSGIDSRGSTVAANQELTSVLVNVKI